MVNPPPDEPLPNRSLEMLVGLAHVDHQTVKLAGSIPEDTALPAKKFGWDMNKPWKWTRWYVRDGKTVDDTVSEAAFDDATKTLLIEKSDNDPMFEVMKEWLPTITKATLPYHSEIWPFEYGDEMATGQHLKYVHRNNIINDHTEAVLLAARWLLAPNAKDADVFEVNRLSDNIAEREAFIALAGTDNGAGVFRMLTDRHYLFAGRKVLKVWLWGKARGQCEISDFCLTAMTWELDVDHGI